MNFRLKIVKKNEILPIRENIFITRTNYMEDPELNAIAVVRLWVWLLPLALRGTGPETETVMSGE